MNELLTIGQFSRMSWLSLKALRLYDETGLLHPAHVDPFTNYRYYTADQAPTARAIAILRSLDIPLAQIRELVTEANPEDFRAKLDLHRMVLEERIERHRHMLRRVEDLIRKGSVMTYDITTKDIEPVDVIGLRLTTSPDTISADSSAQGYHRIYAALGSAGIAPAGPPRLVYLDMSDDAWTIECCVPVVGATSAPEGLTLRRFPGGRAATTTHIGPYNELGMAYRHVEVWLGQQGYTTAGAPYDVYVNDPAEVKDPAKFETEIVWPVK